MKKIILFGIVIFSILFSNVNAQKGLHAGIVLQPSLVTMRGQLISISSYEFDPDFNQTIRSSIGACLDYHFTPYIGVGANILYAAQGQKFLVTDTSGHYGSHFYKFNFVKVPLFLSYNSGGKKARLMGTIGPQLLILTSAKDKFAGKDYDIIDSYAPLSLGFNFGIGIGFFLVNNAMLTIAPNFDVAFLNYNYTTDSAPPAYIGKSPVTTSFGIQFGIRYVKNEPTPDDEAIKAY